MIKAGSRLLAGSEGVDRRLLARTKIILFSQFAIHRSRNLRSRWAFYAPRIAAQQHGECNFWVGFIRVRHKPPDARWIRVIVARARFAERRFIPAAVVAG